MKYYILFILLAFSYSVTAQSVFDDYKYIIVPKKFDNFKKENQYKTSTLVKHLLTEKGFNAVYEDAFPEDLLLNRCLGLLVRLHDKSSMFSTKEIISFEDCGSKEIYRTEEGKSKEKEYKLAYTEAIRNAMKSLDVINYSYNKPTNKPLVVSYKKDVKKLSLEDTSDTPKSMKKQVVIQEATQETQTYKNLEPVASNYKKPSKKIEKIQSFSAEEVLYAQEIENGYQLVDSTPKVRLKVYNTSVKDVYLAKQGILFAKEGKWFYEYYVEGSLHTKELTIKF